MTTQNVKRFIVMNKMAKMPGSCYGAGSYRRIAVVETDGLGIKPKFIGTHARHVVQVVETWERRFCGKTYNCAFWRAYAEAEKLCDKLNQKGCLQASA